MAKGGFSLLQTKSGTNSHLVRPYVPANVILKIVDWVIGQTPATQLRVASIVLSFVSFARGDSLHYLRTEDFRISEDGFVITIRVTKSSAVKVATTVPIQIHWSGKTSHILELF